MLDPWKHPYQYRYPGTHNPKRPDVWSYGPDGVEANDDITSWEGGQTAFEQLWSADRRPTAIVAMSDIIAIGVMDAAKARRLHLPLQPSSSPRYPRTQRPRRSAAPRSRGRR